MYTNLHLHDHFSTLDGFNTPEEYMVRAKELGMTHLAQTNHGTLSGHRDFMREAKNAGIVPILGLEAYISSTDRFDKRSKAKREDGTSVYNHIVLLAQNDTGLETLMRINAEAFNTGFYFKPRIDTELLLSDNEGLIVLSGCMNGLIAKALEAGNMEEAMRVANQYKDGLGERFFIEVQSHNPPELNHALLDVADRVGIRPVMTNDCHYANKDDLWKEEALLILNTGPKASKEAEFSKSQKMDILDRFNYLYPERPMSYQEIEIYLRDYDTEKTAFVAQGIERDDIFTNTMDIASTVGEYPFHAGLDLLPQPKSENVDDLLHKKALAGLRKRGLADNPDAVSRLEYELNVIKTMGFSAYFIVVGNLVAWSKSQGIRVGPGRGSAAGSLVVYALGITEVNPLPENLIFERFLNPERGDWPDIDIDFQDTRRKEVKGYLERLYKHVANIMTISKFQGKSAIKAAARIYRVPYADVEKALKNNEFEVDYFENFVESEKGRVFHKKYPEVMELAKILEGRIASTGLHAGGFIVSKEDIFKYAPMETAKDPSDDNGPRIPMVALDMNEVADIGLIKIDLLGLKALSIIEDTIALVKQHRGEDIIIEDIPMDDKNVYAMLSDGYTKAVFQCEQPAYTGLLVRMGGVKDFQELAASNALVRPGAANTIGTEYIARKNGEKMVTYKHPLMKEFTGETYGEILYQEQVMLTMTELAGLSMATADKVRKIIGKKKDVSEFDAFREQFVEGASKKVKRAVAEKLWKDFEAHAGYSFNKSHAVAYSLISYQTAWLKYHYPAEFMAAVLRNEKDKDAITDYLIEAKRLGLGVLLPHVNKSQAKVSLENGNIRLGLESLKYISDKVSPRLLEARPFKSYAELVELKSQKGSGISSRVLESLNAVGAAVFADNPLTGKERDNLYEYLQIPAFEVRDMEPRVKYKFADLDNYDETGVFAILGMVRGIKRGDGWSRVDMLDETGSAGVFADENIPVESGQKYAFLIADNRIVRFSTVDDVIEKAENGFIKYLYDEVKPPEKSNQYRTMAFRTHLTKAKREKMAYLVVMDHLGHMSTVMVWPSLYNRAVIQCRPGAVFTAEMKELDKGGFAIKELL